MTDERAKRAAERCMEIMHHACPHFSPAIAAEYADLYAENERLKIDSAYAKEQAADAMKEAMVFAKLLADDGLYCESINEAFRNKMVLIASDFLKKQVAELDRNDDH